MPGAPRISRRAIVQLRHEGYTARQIGVRIEASERSVQRILGELGYTKRNPMSQRRIDGDLERKIKDALEDGWPWTEITETFRVADSTLRRHFPGTGWTSEQKAEHAVVCARYRGVWQ